MKRGVLMIPLPTAIDNHQLKNAESIFAEGMGIIHQQKDSIDSLVLKLKEIINNKDFENWKQIKSNRHNKAKKIMLDNIHKYFDQNEKI